MAIALQRRHAYNFLLLHPRIDPTEIAGNISGCAAHAAHRPEP